MRDNLRAALELADMGNAIFPLHSPTAAGCDCGNPTCGSAAKHPRTRHGLKDASTALDQITEWWKMWPQANIGVATGPPSGVVVVDVDPRHEGDIAWAKLCEEHAYEHTGPVSATGGGGWHYWFKHPGSFIPSRNGDLGTGIDVKSDGGYVVAPGSVHATGAAYEWYAGSEPWNCRVGEIPGWLLDLMRRRMEAQHRAEPVPDIIRDGYRHEHLLSLAGSMRSRNMGERAIFKALLEENAEKCVPPVTQTDIAKLAASAGSWPPGEARILKFPNSKTAGGSVERRKRPDPAPFTAQELYDRVLPDVRWAVEGLLPEGMGLLAGKPKLGKSWLALGMAVAIAEGGIVMGTWPVEDGEVLGLFLEDNDRRLQGRMRTLCGRDRDAWPARLFLETEWPRLDEGGLETLDTWLGLHTECRLVVIDTLAKFRPKGGGNPRGRGNAYEEDYGAMEGIQSLALRHNVAILLLTHFNKSMAEDDVDKVTGSTGTTGVADTILLLKRPRGQHKDEDSTLFVTGRDVEENEWAVHFDGQLGRWTVIGDADDAKTSKEAQALVAFMLRLGRPVNKDDVAAGLGLTGPTAKKRLQRAGWANFIESAGEGFYRLVVLAETDVRGAVPPVPPVPKAKNGDRGAVPVPVEPVQGRDRGTEGQQGQQGQLGTGGHRGQGDRGTRGQEIEKNAEKLYAVAEQRSRGEESAGPPMSCPKCGERAWVRRAAGGWVCGDCKPWLQRVDEEGDAS